VDEHGRYIVRDIFRWMQTGKDESGKFIGEMISTGYVPTFFEEFIANKLPFPKTNFKPPEWAIPLLKKTG